MSSNFETAANWNTIPANDLITDLGLFSGPVTANLPQLSVSRSISGLLFNTAIGSWTLGSMPNATLTAGGSGISTVGQTSGTTTISASLALGAAQTWTAGTGGNLLLTGSLTGSNGFPLTINSSGNSGNVIFSPSSGNSVSFTGSNNSNFFLQARSGGLLILGGDGITAPATTSTNTIVNSSTGSSYGTISITGGGAMQVNSGTWILGDIGRNSSSDNAIGTIHMQGGSLLLAGARYFGSGTLNVSGGTLKSTNTNSVYTNGGRFSMGAIGSGVANMNLSGGFVDLATANGGNSFGSSISTKVNHTGGILQNGVTTSSGVNSGTVNSLTIGASGSISNNSSAYSLSGNGILVCAGAIQGQAITTGTNDLSNFNFNGGTLAVATFNAANLGYSSLNGVAGDAPNPDPVANCVGKGTLYNNGGTLAPGNTGTAGKSVITGNYTINGGSLGIDLGGTNQATAFQTGLYDFLSISGNAALGGNITLSTINGYSPSNADSYTILISAGTLSGNFSNVAFGNRLVTTDYAGSFVVSRIGNSVTLGNYEATPVPTITSQPSNVNIALGGSVTFSVAGTSMAPLSYQWRVGGIAISGATASNYTIASATVGDMGSYDVVVSNLAGGTTSNTASLYVIAPPPVISSQPVALTVASGSSAVFSVTASSFKPLYYQWRRNGTNLTGANSNTFTKTPARLVDAGSYDLIVSNDDAFITSSAATLSVNIAPPVITSQPVSQLVPIGNTALFTFGFYSEGPVTYQWRKNGTIIAGATSSSYSQVNVQPLSAASFDVTVSNSGGSITSNMANLTIDLFTPDIRGQYAITYDTTSVRPVLSVPAGGIHPRIYFNTEDLSDIRNRLSNTATGQEAFTMVKLYTDLLRRGRTLAYDTQPSSFRTMPDGTARISNAGLYDRSVIYNELVAGNTTTLVSMINAADATGLYTLSGEMSLEAFECLVNEGQTGVATRATNLAAALNTWASYVLTLTDFPGVVGATYSNKLTNHYKFGGYHNALTYDMAYNAMTQSQRDNVRKVLAKMMGGYFASDYSNTEYTDVGVAPESSAGNHVAINSFKLVTACALEGEVLTTDAGYSATDLSSWFNRAMGSYHKFLTYGWYASGAPLEGQGKNYLYGAHLIAFAKRGYNFFGHPHLQAYSKDWLPAITQPYGYSVTAFDLLGGTGPVNEKGKQFINSLDYVGLKWMLPGDIGADFAWRNFVNTEYKDGSGNYQTFLDLRDGKFSLRSVYHNQLLPAAIFASDVSSTSTWTQHNSSALGALDYLDNEGGTIVSRSDYAPDATALLFHVRQDMGGHTFADRNTFTLSALGRLFINYNSGSTSSGLQAGTLQSIVEVDGISMKVTPQEGSKMRIPSKLAAWSPLGGQATFATGDATYCYSQEWRWNNYSTGPVTITSGYTAENNCHNSFRRADNRIPESFGDAPFVSFPHWESPGLFEGIQAKPYNTMRQVYRTTGLIRGIKPYALVIDDVQKDLSNHSYKWLASIPKDISILTDTALPAGANPATDVVLKEDVGTRCLLVRIVRALGTPARTTTNPNQGTTLAYTETLSNTGTGESWKRLVIERASIVAPEYRVLLFPFRIGDALPTTTFSGTTLSVMIGSQSDVYTFSPRTSTVGGQSVTMNEFTLVRNGGATLLDYRNQIEPMATRLPSGVLDTPPTAPSNLVATLSGGSQVRLDWTDNANNENAYIVERSNAGTNNWLPLQSTLPANTMSYTDSSTTSSTSYNYRVRCVAPNGLSNFANISFTTP